MDEYNVKYRSVEKHTTITAKVKKKIKKIKINNKKKKKKEKRKREHSTILDQSLSHLANKMIKYEND